MHIKLRIKSEIQTSHAPNRATKKWHIVLSKLRNDDHGYKTDNDKWTTRQPCSHQKMIAPRMYEMSSIDSEKVHYGPPNKSPRWFIANLGSSLMYCSYENTHPKFGRQKLQHRRPWYWIWINTNSLQKPRLQLVKSVKSASYFGSITPTGSIFRHEKDHVKCINRH